MHSVSLVLSKYILSQEKLYPVHQHVVYNVYDAETLKSFWV